MADQLGYLGDLRRGALEPTGETVRPYCTAGGGLREPDRRASPRSSGRATNGNAGGDWAVWDGSRWNSLAGGTHGFPHADAQIGSTMSCAAGLCMGLDNQRASGLVGYAYNGRSWSVTGRFGNGAKPPSLLACASSRVVHGALCRQGSFTRYQLGLPPYGGVTS